MDGSDCSIIAHCDNGELELKYNGISVNSCYVAIVAIFNYDKNVKNFNSYNV